MNKDGMYQEGKTMELGSPQAYQRRWERMSRACPTGDDGEPAARVGSSIACGPSPAYPVIVASMNCRAMIVSHIFKQSKKTQKRKSVSRHVKVT